MRTEQPLGEAETDDLGQYIIRYGSEQFATGDVPSASATSLIVRAFAGEQQIGNDVTPPKPTRDEVVDFQVPAPVLSTDYPTLAQERGEEPKPCVDDRW